MKRQRCFLLLAVILAWGVPLKASDFTLFGGFNHPGEVTLGQASGALAGTGAGLTDAKDFGVFGARLYRSNASIGLEHTVAYSPNFLASDASALIYNTNLLVQVPEVVVQPYATVGMGLVRAGGSGPAAFGSKFSINYGVGVKASLFGPLGLRLDVRGYSIRGVEDRTLRVLESTVGLVFGF